MRLDMIQHKKDMLEKKYGEIVRLHSPVNHVEQHFAQREASITSNREFSAGRVHSNDRLSKHLRSANKRPSRDQSPSIIPKVLNKLSKEASQLSVKAKEQLVGALAQHRRGASVVYAANRE